jgi:sterol 3beta-glucosyltransferase
LHHGGAGTVGASLRAGIPTLIKPWFGDQFFWFALRRYHVKRLTSRANRVTKLGVGLKVPSLRSDDIARCLHKATTSMSMIEEAKRLGELIRSENGVDNAVAAIQFNIVRAVSDRRKMTYQK